LFGFGKIMYQPTAPKTLDNYFDKAETHSFKVHISTLNFGLRRLLGKLEITVNPITHTHTHTHTHTNL
jgi:hypothetical protein